MPIYEYICRDCGTKFEEWLKASESDKEQPCPSCEGLSPRCVSQTSFVLKGSGWYVTEYGKNSASSDKSANKPESAENSNTAPEKNENSSSSSEKNDNATAAESSSSSSEKQQKDAKPVTDKKNDTVVQNKSTKSENSQSTTTKKEKTTVSKA